MQGHHHTGMFGKLLENRGINLVLTFQLQSMFKVTSLFHNEG